ncbi:hypothetical protein KK120_08880 [Virgibacillus dakarensis]|nr:hypothetical protein [Virgibacillus dakarensis]MBT2215936.1 hypothetical protein [Virgibacillus dakarensis]
MWQGMKSVMVFDPKDTDEQTATKFMDWMRDNKSAVQDRAVPNAEQTRKLLSRVD